MSLIEKAQKKAECKESIDNLTKAIDRSKSIRSKISMARLKSKKITDSAKGEDCQVRLAGICNFDRETTVAAHLGGGGMGVKVDDIFIAYSCSSCHSAIDGQTRGACSREELKLAHLEGVIRTQRILLKKGLIKI